MSNKGKQVEVYLRDETGWAAATILQQAVNAESLTATFIGANMGGIIVSEEDAKCLVSKLTEIGFVCKIRALKHAKDSPKKAAKARAKYIHGAKRKKGD